MPLLSLTLPSLAPQLRAARLAALSKLPPPPADGRGQEAVPGWGDTEPMLYRSEAFLEDLQHLERYC